MDSLELIASQEKLYDRMIKPIAEQYGITSMEYSILLFLANNPKHDTAAEIVEIRHLTKSHVSTSIRSLEEKGYLKKEQRDGNHRTTHLVLLPPTKNIISAGRKAHKEYLAVLTKGFSKEEIRLLDSYTKRMLENVSEVLRESENNRT